MKWDDNYESPDVEDRRGQGPPMQGGGGMGFLLPLAFRFGWKGVLVALVIYAGVRYFGGGLGGSHVVEQQRAGHDNARAFVGYVLDDVQKTWAQRINGYQ